MKSQNCSEYQIFQSFCKHIMQNKENLQQWGVNDESEKKKKHNSLPTTHSMTKQEIESKKDLLKIFCFRCCCCFLCASRERRSETANKFLNLRMSRCTKKKRQWNCEDYRESINNLLVGSSLNVLLI